MCGVIVAGGCWRIRPQTFLRDAILIDHMHLKPWMSARPFIRSPFPLLSKIRPPFFFFYKKKFLPRRSFWAVGCRAIYCLLPDHLMLFPSAFPA